MHTCGFHILDEISGRISWIFFFFHDAQLSFLGGLIMHSGVGGSGLECSSWRAAEYSPLPSHFLVPDS